MGCSGHIFFAVPSPLSLLLFKLKLVSISSGVFGLFFFFCFFGDVFVAAGRGDADGADVTGAGVAGVSVAGVAGFGVIVGSDVGVAFAATTAAAAVWAFF